MLYLIRNTDYSKNKLLSSRLALIPILISAEILFKFESIMLDVVRTLYGKKHY